MHNPFRLIIAGKNRVKASDLRVKYPQDGLKESAILLIPPVLYLVSSRFESIPQLVHLYRDNSPSGMFADRAVI